MKILIVKKENCDNTILIKDKVIELFKSFCDDCKIDEKFRDELTSKVEDYNFIIAIGGDGTVLSASKWIYNDIKLIGINSNPNESVGFLTIGDIEVFKNLLPKIINNQVKFSSVLRLEAEIVRKNEKGELLLLEKIPLALNDIFFGNEVGHKIMKYDMNIDGDSESIHSSGLIVSTPIGSTAWAKSAGGIVTDTSARVIQIINREVFMLKSKNVIPNPYIVHEDKVIEVIPHNDYGYVVSDSALEMHHIQNGEILRIKASKNDLKLLLKKDNSPKIIY